MVDVVKQDGGVLQLTDSQVSELVNDKDFRQLSMGSDEFNTAIEAKASVKEQTTGESEPSGDTEQKEAKVQDVEAESEGKTKEPADTEDDAKYSEKARKRISALLFKQRQLEAELVKKVEPVEKNEPAKVEVQQQFSKPKPKAEDFEDKTIGEYNEALIEWQVEKREFVREQQQQLDQAKSKANEALATFVTNGKALETELELEDGEFSSVVNARDFNVKPLANAAILKHPNGARIAYEIASDEDQKAAFSKMDPIEQAVYVGTVAGKLELLSKTTKSTNKETKLVTGAKKPGKEIAKGNGKSLLNDIPMDNQKDFERVRNERRKTLGLRV